MREKTDAAEREREIASCFLSRKPDERLHVLSLRDVDTRQTEPAILALGDGTPRLILSGNRILFLEIDGGAETFAKLKDEIAVVVSEKNGTPRGRRYLADVY
jgi:hypothetical protein